MTARRRQILLWLLLALACVAFALSLLPESAKQALHTTGKLHFWLHFALFFVFGALTVLSSAQIRVQLLLLAAAILFGLMIEYAETVRFGVIFEPYDVITDIYGLLFGAVTTHLLSRKRR